MTTENVKTLLAEKGLLGRLHEFEASTATVQLAAEQLGVDPDRIAKTLGFYLGDGAVLVVAAGSRRIDNHKFKEHFGCKARMLAGEDVNRLTGYYPGGVCPFLAPEGLPVWLDVSLRDHETVYPAAGNAHTGVELSCAELEDLARPAGWCDVCKPLEASS